MAICVDTNIFIDFLQGHPPAKHFLSKLLDQANPVYFSAITEAELLSGQSCKVTKTREAIISLLNSFTKVEVDNPIAQLSGYIRRTHHTDLADAMIAATALKMEATLYTRNQKDYTQIAHLHLESPYA
ncbi:MAG: type II toxin-antitoxin system VapC family toxin [Patescibacteria group bacterium]